MTNSRHSEWIKMIWVSFIFLLNFSNADAFTACLKSEDCQQGEHCSNGFCSECFNCTILNRKRSSECDRVLDDCGECLPEYEEVPVTTYKRKASCQLKQKAQVRTSECQKDEDCSLGNFCFEKKLCAKCFDCEYYKRQFPVNFICAKEPKDCGPCLFGHDEILTTDDSVLKPCQAQEYKMPISSSSTGIQLTITVVSVFSIILILFALFVKYGKRALAQPATRCTEAPTYSPPLEYPPAPPYTEPLVSEECTTICTYEEEKEVRNLAIGFRYPTASYYPRQAPAEEQLPEEVVDGVTVPEGSHEETENNTSEDESNLCASFSDILNTITEEDDSAISEGESLSTIDSSGSNVAELEALTNNDSSSVSSTTDTDNGFSESP